MDSNYLKDEGNALITQKHQINNAQNKLSEINNALTIMQNEQTENREKLDNLMESMESLLASIDSENYAIDEQAEQEGLLLLQRELDSMEIESQSKLHTIDELDSVLFNDNMSWEDYKISFSAYAERNHIDLSKDPFESLMSKAQQIELQKRIKEDFSFKNAQCDKYDYMIAGTCGLIGGLVDILFVGKPKEGKLLGEATDNMANKATIFIAQCVNKQKFDPNNIRKEYETYTANEQEKGEKILDFDGFMRLKAIEELANKFKVKYDQTSLDDRTLGGIKLSPNNHHLLSLGHNPDLIGLIVSIINQFTNTSTFVGNGEIITIDTKDNKTPELQGGNFVAKIFCGFVNWFFHLASDWAGSETSAEKGNRGSGIPIPFYHLFQHCDFGSFGEKKQTLAQISTKIFEQGYDFRHGLSMAIPVAITELLIRFMYVMKQRFYHSKDWKDCMPNSSIPELRRMLLVGHGVLCTMDGIDAYMRSEILRANLIAWVNFGQLALRDLHAWYNSGNIDIEAIDEYMDRDLKRMLKMH